jgi:hypothetical protein
MKYRHLNCWGQLSWKFSSLRAHSKNKVYVPEKLLNRRKNTKSVETHKEISGWRNRQWTSFLDYNDNVHKVREALRSPMWLIWITDRIFRTSPVNARSRSCEFSRRVFLQTVGSKKRYSTDNPKKSHVTFLHLPMTAGCEITPRTIFSLPQTNRCELRGALSGFFLNMLVLPEDTFMTSSTVTGNATRWTPNRTLVFPRCFLTEDKRSSPSVRLKNAFSWLLPCFRGRRTQWRNQRNSLGPMLKPEMINSWWQHRNRMYLYLSFYSG